MQVPASMYDVYIILNAMRLIYWLSIFFIHSVATVVAAMHRVRSDSTNQMQENILYLSCLVPRLRNPLFRFKNRLLHPDPATLKK